MSYSCIVCSRGVRKNSKALECEECKEWCHIRCGIEITLAQYELVTQGKLEYAQVPQNLLIVICFWKNVLQYL